MNTTANFSTDAVPEMPTVPCPLSPPSHLPSAHQTPRTLPQSLKDSTIHRHDLIHLWELILQRAFKGKELNSPSYLTPLWGRMLSRHLFSQSWKKDAAACTHISSQGDTIISPTSLSSKQQADAAPDIRAPAHALFWARMHLRAAAPKSSSLPLVSGEESQ